MDTREDTFTKILLIVAFIAGITMLVLGFTRTGSIYKDLCGAVCAACVFFMLNDADTSEGAGRVIALRVLIAAWGIYSAYHFIAAIL